MIRTNLRFIVTGTSKDEVERKLKERVAIYLSVDTDSVEQHADIEMFIGVGEEGPLQLTFTAECNVRLK